LALLADVARNPSFPQEEVERERKLRLAALAQEESRPNGIAARVGPMLVYGQNHPYGTDGSSTVESGAENEFTATYGRPISASSVGDRFSAEDRRICAETRAS